MFIIFAAKSLFPVLSTDFAFRALLFRPAALKYKLRALSKATAFTERISNLKRINSNDIARLAGVSRSTVSRVVNGYSNVPEETREKVMKVIKEHHYYPLLSGQLLTGKGTKTLGLF